MNKSKEDYLKQDFLKVLNKICLELSEDEVCQMKFMLSDDIPKSKSESATTAHNLMSLMKEGGIISFDNTNRLVGILLDLGRKDLVKELESFNRLLHMTKSVPHNVKANMVVKHFKETETSTKLSEHLRMETVVILTGLLGSGKSQNALWYGCKHKKLYPDSTVWRCYAKDKGAFQSSLKCLADDLSVSERIPETSNADTAITVLTDLILKELQRRCVEGSHLIIIDDVGKECVKVVEAFIDSFMAEESNTQFIITTCIKFVCKDKQQLHVRGFSEKESVEFLSEEQTDINEKKKGELLELAKTLGHLPMALYAARRYISSMCIGPTTFMRYLKSGENLEFIDQEIRNLDFGSDEKLLFSALRFTIYEFFQKNVSQNVFQMFQMLQFLEVDDIPLILFEFIPLDSTHDASLVTNSLVQAVHMHSFGILGGEDDTRYLSTHSAIALTLRMYTKEEEKTCLVHKLLWAFALLLNKDVFRKKDLARQKLLLPHMRSVLKHAERILTMNDMENQMLMAFVNDLVGYAHNFEGLMKTAGEFSDEAKRYCFQLIGQKEEKIDEDIKKQITNFNEVEFSSFEEFTRKKAKYIFKKLQEKTENSMDILKIFVPKFIANRYRVPDNMQILSKSLEETQSDLHLTKQEYEKLVKSRTKMAVPFEAMTRTFLFELILAVFYTHGRRLFYVVAEMMPARKFYEYVYLAKEIGQCIISNQPEFPPLDTLLSERNGTLETCFNNHGLFESDRSVRLDAAVTRFETLFEDKTNYYVYGVLKMNAAEDDHHKTNCLKQLLRCFTTMISMEQDELKKQKIYEKGCEHAEKVLAMANREQMQDRRSLPGIKVRVAEFYCCPEVPTDNIQKAEELFECVCPKYLTEKVEDTNSDINLDRHEKAAAYGLIECYIKSNQRDKAINLLWNLKSKTATDAERELQKLSELGDRVRLLGLQ